MPGNLLPISTQVLPAGSTRDPGAHRGLAPRDGLGGGQGTSPGVASGTSRGGGWRPSPASAAPLPCCHSNALGPPPQHPAASRSIPQHGARARDGDTAQPSPHSPRTPDRHPRLSPHPPHGTAAPGLSLPPSREKGDAPQQPGLPQAHPASRTGGVSMWRGPQAMEVMSCWEINPVWGHCYTRGWYSRAMSHQATHQVLICGPTPKQGWHFENFTGHPRCSQRSNRWTRLAGGGTAAVGL